MRVTSIIYCLKRDGARLDLYFKEEDGDIFISTSHDFTLETHEHGGSYGTYYNGEELLTISVEELRLILETIAKDELKSIRLTKDDHDN